MSDTRSSALAVLPIGFVASPRRNAVDDDWSDVEATITLVAPYGPDALRGLEAFSHVEVIYVFHGVDAASVHKGARVPRGNPAWPEVGIFAQRGRVRPNRLGVTTAEIVAVDGLDLHVRGLDAVDGTPVLDIKPCMREFAPRGEVREPAWAEELMAGYF